MNRVSKLIKELISNSSFIDPALSMVEEEFDFNCLIDLPTSEPSSLLLPLDSSSIILDSVLDTNEVFGVDNDDEGSEDSDDDNILEGDGSLTVDRSGFIESLDYTG
jgi:hypothetical protein